MQDARVDEARDALERVYRSERDRLWRSLLAFSGNPEIASDSMAEAFAQLLRRGERVRDPVRWVWRAAFRIAAGELKARSTTRGVMPETAYEMEEPARELVAALALLSDRQRLAVVLHDAAGYPAGDVARLIGSTPAAVRVHLMRARRRLRELMGEEP